MESTDLENETIRQCLKAIRQNANHAFILVGGAGGILAGSNRTTADIDLLLAANVDSHTLHKDLLRIDGFSAPSGILTFQGPISMTIDFLKTVVLEKTYEDLSEHTFLQGEVALLNLDAALAVKIHCVHQRADDENGEMKKQTDLEDIKWLSSQMVARELTISDRVATMFKIGHYNLLLVRFELSKEEVERLVAVGTMKLLYS